MLLNSLPLCGCQTVVGSVTHHQIRPVSPLHLQHIARVLVHLLCSDTDNLFVVFF